MIRHLRRVNADARVGLKLAVAVWAVVLVFQLPGLRRIVLAVDLVALAAALFAAVLGGSVFQVYRVPRDARRFIEEPTPNILLGVATLAVSLAVILTVFSHGCGESRSLTGRHFSRRKALPHLQSSDHTPQAETNQRVQRLCTLLAGIHYTTGGGISRGYFPLSGAFFRLFRGRR